MLLILNKSLLINYLFLKLSFISYRHYIYKNITKNDFCFEKLRNFSQRISHRYIIAHFSPYFKGLWISDNETPAGVSLSSCLPASGGSEPRQSGEPKDPLGDFEGILRSPPAGESLRMTKTK
ncbi:MAG: hypothetical protein PHD72_03340 [Patescibacteria group bacterium]|nr:hypothetical protein [Patescibacteria group bacterium]